MFVCLRLQTLNSSSGSSDISPGHVPNMSVQILTQFQVRTSARQVLIKIRLHSDVLYCLIKINVQYILNANMADHSGSTQDKRHESKCSQALMFCFDNASSEKSFFVFDFGRIE